MSVDTKLGVMKVIVALTVLYRSELRMVKTAISKKVEVLVNLKGDLNESNYGGGNKEEV